MGSRSYLFIKPTCLSTMVGLISNGGDTTYTLEVENLLLKNKLTLNILKTKELRFYFMQWLFCLKWEYSMFLPPNILRNNLQPEYSDSYSIVTCELTTLLFLKCPIFFKLIFCMMTKSIIFHQDHSMCTCVFYLCLYLEIYWTFQKWNLFFIELYEFQKTVVCFYCGHKGTGT